MSSTLSLSAGIDPASHWFEEDLKFVTCIVFIGFALAFLPSGLAIWRARILFEGSTLFVRGPFDGESRYDWADLQRIQNNADGAECRLALRDQNSAKISHYYSSVERLIWLANEKRRGNARTP